MHNREFILVLLLFPQSKLCHTKILSPDRFSNVHLYCSKFCGCRKWIFKQFSNRLDYQLCGWAPVLYQCYDYKSDVWVGNFVSSFQCRMILNSFYIVTKNFCINLNSEYHLTIHCSCFLMWGVNFVRVGHWEGSGKPGGLEIKWYTSASSLWW